MEDLGPPSSYMALRPGTPVYSSNGSEVGKVERVLSAPKAQIFDGIVVDTSDLPGGHRFVDAPEVDAIYERGVVLAIDAAAAAELPEPSPGAATLAVRPGDLRRGGVRDKLRRAWDLLSGRH